MNIKLLFLWCLDHFKSEDTYCDYCCLQLPIHPDEHPYWCESKLSIWPIIFADMAQNIADKIDTDILLEICKGYKSGSNNNTTYPPWKINYDAGI